jgi:hypothetical protein
MHRKNLLVIIALLLCAAGATRAQTQTDEHKFEIGGLYTAIGPERLDATLHGLGGRLGYNFNRYIALDTEANFFPETHLGNNQTGQRGQLFAGIKAGTHTKYVGLFAKARPGVMFNGALTSGFDCSRSATVTVCRPEHHNFALDAGGVLEFYPATRAIIRLDAGDTIVRERQTTMGFLTPVVTTSATTHNFQVSLGFSYRF